MYRMSNSMQPSMFENMTCDVHSYTTKQADLLYVRFSAAVVI